MDLAIAAWSLTHGLATLLVDGQLQSFGFGEDSAETLAAMVTRILAEGLHTVPVDADRTTEAEQSGR
jgi:hypothetical protein